MNTHCWNNLAFIIHIRVECEERIQNLNKVMNHYRAASPDIQFIIIEDDVKSNPLLKQLLQSSLMRQGDRYKLICNKGAYRRPLAFNMGAMMTDRNVLGFIDTDVIIHPASIDMTRKCLQDKTFDVMWPFNGIALYLNKKGRDVYFQNPLVETLGSFLPKVGNNVPIPLKDKLFMETPMLRVENIHSKGGAVMMHRDCFNETGGWNIDFKGWGYEDNEIELRMTRMNQKIGRVRGPMEVLFHLWHPRTKENASAKPEHEFLKHNMGILQAIKDADELTLRGWIGTQHNIVKEMVNQ